MYYLYQGNLKLFALLGYCNFYKLEYSVSTSRRTCFDSLVVQTVVLTFKWSMNMANVCAELHCSCCPAVMGVANNDKFKVHSVTYAKTLS